MRQVKPSLFGSFYEYLLSRSLVSAMDIGLPKFINKSCNHIVVCAKLEVHSDVATVEKEDLIVQVKYEYSDSLCWARLNHDKLKKNIAHLHFEAATDEFFGDSPPEEVKTLQEMSSIVSEYYGEQASIQLEASYITTESRLPENGLIRPFLGVAAQADGAKLLLTGGEFQIVPEDNEDPFLIRWRRINESEIQFKIKAARDLMLQELYLINSEALLNKYFDRFILEGSNE